MLVLDDNNDTIRLVTGSAVSTDWTASYADIGTGGGSFDIRGTGGNVNTATTTVIVGTTTVRRQVKYLSIYNAGAADQTVTIERFDGTNARIVRRQTLRVGETLEYVDGKGFRTLDAQGCEKVRSAMVGQMPLVRAAPHFATANLTSVKSLTTGTSFALYMGKAPRALTSVQVRSRVTTAMATITWGEIALAVGTPVPGGNPSLTVVGFADVSASWNSLGQKTNTINVSAGQVVNEGDDLWLIVGNAATTVAVLRAASIADDLQGGLQAAVAVRPSTIVGVATSFTIEGATVLPAWLYIVF